MIIKINENQYNNIFLLVEGAEANNERAARDYLRTKRRLNDEQALRVIGTVKHDIPNSRLAKSKFMLGVVRISCEDNMVYEDIVKLNTLLAYIASEAHVNEYDRNLNGLTFDEINSRFSTIMMDDMEAEKSELSTIDYIPNTNYTIVPIKSHEEAKKYAKYTTWCVTQDDGLYNSYTYGGIGMFYFCLKNGFESIDRQPGEGCPLDEYGLSMIAVSVTPEGAPNTITCRWNHDNKGNDKVMSPKQLSLIIGKNFYEAFPPKYTEQELRNLGFVPKKEALQILANGGDPNLCSKTISYLLKKDDKDIMKYVHYFCYALDDNYEVHEYDSMDRLEGDGFDSSYAVEAFYVNTSQGKTLQNPVTTDEFGEKAPALDEWVENFVDTDYESIYIFDTKDGKQNIVNALVSPKPILPQNADAVLSEYSIYPVEKRDGWHGRTEAKKITFIARYDNKYALFSDSGKQLSDFYTWMRLEYRYNPDCPYYAKRFDGLVNALGIDGQPYLSFWCNYISSPPSITHNYVGIVKVQGKCHFISPDGKKIISDGYDFIKRAYEGRFGERKVYSCETYGIGREYIEDNGGKLVKLT